MNRIALKMKRVVLMLRVFLKFMLLPPVVLVVKRHLLLEEGGEVCSRDGFGE
jgi:hypothetical protein